MSGLKIWLGLEKMAPPKGRLVILFQSTDWIVVAPTIIGRFNSIWRNMSEATRLPANAVSEELGGVLQRGVELVRFDPTYRGSRKTYPYGVSPDLKRLTSFNRTKSFYRNVKYVQVYEEHGIVKCQSSVAGELFTYTPVFDAPLNDPQKLGKAARDALEASTFR